MGHRSSRGSTSGNVACSGWGGGRCRTGVVGGSPKSTGFSAALMLSPSKHHHISAGSAEVGPFDGLPSTNSG